MFKLILKRHGPVVNVLRRHVVKRQINKDAVSASFSFRKRYELIENSEKQFFAKQMRLNNVNSRKYASLPKPVEDGIPRKFFYSHEDSFAHSILESKEIYSGNIVKGLPVFEEEITKNEVENYINKSWKAVPVPEIIEAFKRTSYYASKNHESIVDEKYDKLLKYLMVNCGQFTDSELSDVLQSIVIWPFTYTRHNEKFQSLYRAFDKECLRRASQWTFDEMLLFSDHWYRLKLFRYSEFCAYVIKKLGFKSSRMTPSNLVQYMFYVNASRRHPGDMYNIEYKMESYVDELDLNELAIIAMGFFKSQTPIRSSKLLVKIIHRVIKEVDTINEISLSAFMKVIRYSSTMQNECAIVWELLVSTVPQIPRLSLQALIHILTTVVKMRIFHKELLTSIAERFNREIKDARLKDMERLVLGLTCFDFTPDIQPNIFRTVVQEISTPERHEDLKRYPRSLASLLQYLGVVNLYPKDLIALTLDPVNLRNVYGTSAYSFNPAILVIDLNVDVEVPDYTGPRLSNKTRAIIAKGSVNKIPEPSHKHLSARHIFLLEIMDTCKEIFGSTDKIHLDWVLPQYNEADVIMCLDKNNSLLPVEPILSEMPFGDVKRRPHIYPEGSRWIALVVGAQNCYVRDTTRFLGKDSIKNRQLERIGYKPVVIPWYEWLANEQDRKNYLQRKLFE